MWTNLDTSVMLSGCAYSGWSYAVSMSGFSSTLLPSARSAAAAMPAAGTTRCFMLITGNFLLSSSTPSPHWIGIQRKETASSTGLVHSTRSLAMSYFEQKHAKVVPPLHILSQLFARELQALVLSRPNMPLNEPVSVVPKPSLVPSMWNLAWARREEGRLRVQLGRNKQKEGFLTGGGCGI